MCVYIYTHISVQTMLSLHKNIILVLILRNMLFYFYSGFLFPFFPLFLKLLHLKRNIIFHEKWESSTKEHSGLSEISFWYGGRSGALYILCHVVEGLVNVWSQAYISSSLLLKKPDSLYIWQSFHWNNTNIASIQNIVQINYIQPVQTHIYIYMNICTCILMHE